MTADIQRTTAPVTLLWRLTMALIPEHLSAALPVALMLAVALSVRRMVATGEWQILSAAGMGRNRKLTGIFAVAILAAGLQLAVRLEWRPAGERALDATYRGLRAGTYGVPLPIAESIELDPSTTLFISAIRHDGRLAGVIVRRDDQSFSAPIADVDHAVDGGIALTLRNGVMITHHDDLPPSHVAFDAIRIRGAPGMIGLVGNDFRHQLDRQSAAGLMHLVSTAPPHASQAALSALVMRIDSALFCLLIPWIGAVLGAPARRSSTPAGIVLAVLVMVAQLKSSAFVEDGFAHIALIAEVLHATVWLGFTLLLLRLENRFGEGFIDAAVTHVWAARPLRRLTFGRRVHAVGGLRTA